MLYVVNTHNHMTIGAYNCYLSNHPNQLYLFQSYVEKIGDVLFFCVLSDPRGVWQKAKALKVSWGVDSQGHSVADGLVET